MIVNARTKKGIENTVIDGRAHEITLVKSFDTDTNMASIYLHNNDGELILDNEGDPVVARVYLPGAKLVSTHLFNRMKESLEKMGKNTGNSNVYEFYKGQFLAFREAMLPEVYGK